VTTLLRASGTYDPGVDVIEFRQLDEQRRAELEGDEEDPFDAVGSTLTWRRKERHVALRRPDGRLVASAGLLLAEVQIDDGAPIAVVGVGGVLVSEPQRGQGLADRVIREALARAAAMGPAVAILFCHPDRAGLYVRHGFSELPPPVMVEQPDGLARMPQVTMWRALSDGGELPRGRVVVRSLPF
jgi:predicted N-acetyltransferase YhbS